MLETRKSLKDRDGWRTVYIVECKSSRSWWATGEFCHKDKLSATREKADLQKEYKNLKFRIAVYVRAEK